MTLGELINVLEKYDPDKTVTKGFHKPHSYRGDYSQLAFELTGETTVGEMLECAKGALGKEFTGYKGGEYEMTEHTAVFIADWGDCGEEIGPMLLHYMFGENKIVEVSEEILTDILDLLGRTEGLEDLMEELNSKVALKGLLLDSITTNLNLHFETLKG